MTMTLPTNKKFRKEAPMALGLIRYFPHALFYVAHVSFNGNNQHNPGQVLHWAREKSTDHEDCIIRHTAEAGGFDDDRLRHSGKRAWRALAALQIELEDAAKAAGITVAELLEREWAASRDATTTSTKASAPQSAQA